MDKKKYLISSLHVDTRGFTLIEVMISLAIFAVFIVAFITGQGYNIADSSIMKQENKLRLLAEQKIYEIIASPPQFTESLTLGKKTKKFKDDENYTATVIYKKLKIPNLSSLTKDDQNQSEEDQASSAVEKKLYENISKNLEEIIWQVEVTVKNTITERSFSANSWLYNHKAKVKFDKF